MEKLFSYGTLQLKRVQLDVFGRTIKGQPDILAGYKKEWIKIKLDPTTHSHEIEEHVVISYTDNDYDLITGTVFLISLAQLTRADEYETNVYKRIIVSLQSGKIAWTYVKNDQGRL